MEIIKNSIIFAAEFKITTMLIQTTLLPLSQLAKNDGQIEGLPANPRIIKDEKYQKLVASIKENPEMLSLRELLVYKHDAHYIIIGGNMRYSAMRELGYEEAPCKIIPEETTVEQLRAYTLKDNSGYGEWDWDMLSGEWEMDELEAAGIDLPFLDGEDHPTNTEAADIEEDDFDETTDEIKTRCQSGDIWLLGQHKLICGDSTKESDIERLLGKEMADLWITDPPYNVNYEGGTDDKLKIANDNMNSGDNGIFKGSPVSAEQQTLSQLAHQLYVKYPTDGKFIVHGGKITICQSQAKNRELRKFFEEKGYKDLIINPLGEWEGGPNVDAGATNRKLGSDMADGVTGGGLHGKDLSKADVSVNIFCHIMAQKTNRDYKAVCAIGDEYVNGIPYAQIVSIAKNYIDQIGGFEKFAEWGLV